MRRLLSSRPRRATAAAAGVAVIALIALAIAGTRPLSIRRYALGAENSSPVAVLKQGQSTCEGPITSPGTVGAVGVFGGSVLGLNRISVTVRDADGGQLLASGHGSATTTPAETRVRLDHAVPGGRPLRYCVRSTLNTYSLLGSPAVVAGVDMTHVAKGAQLEFSLVLFSPPHETLLGSLPTAFSRASLFRPDWVGAWTFWLLLALLVAGFAAVTFGVASAAGQDEAEATPGPDRGGPDDQSGSSASTARQ